ALRGPLFMYPPASVSTPGAPPPPLPPYQVVKVDNAKMGFIGLTFEATPTVVTPTAVAGLEFKPEVPVVNALVHKLRDEQGVRAFVILLHQGGIQSAPFSNAGRYPEVPAGFADVNA